MKPQKDIKDTLRYRNMVANLRSRPPYHQEAMLQKEIAGGKQWRIDAVVDAIQVNPVNWSRIDITGVMISAAMFGRLATIENLCEIFEFKKQNNPQRPVQAAFHVASLHGHYRVADFLYERGARANYEADRVMPAIGAAIVEGKIRKIDYLLKTGMTADYALNFAAAQGSPEVIKHLLAKGANPLSNETGTSAIGIALRYNRPHVARDLLAKVTTLQGHAEAVDDIMYKAVDRGHKDTVKIMLAKGAVTNDLLLQIANHRKDTDMVALVESALPKASVPASTPKTPGL